MIINQQNVMFMQKHDIKKFKHEYLYFNANIIQSNFKYNFKFLFSLKFFNIYLKEAHRSQKMKTIFFIICVLLISTKSITIGSCSKFSLDGQKCEQCVQHFHLYDGSCYVDILGCQSYTFGNICHSCENGYILVNNLCCDHNCLAKLFKRHQSLKVSKTINENFKIFSKILPFINEHYIKGSLHNLVQIEQRTYIDVVRFIILYEFPSGKFKMRRAVIDYVKQNGQIVMVDWSNVQSTKEFMDFHKNQLNIKVDSQINKIIEKAFTNKPIVKLLRKFGLSEIEQYQVVVQQENKQTLLYQTFYFQGDKKLILTNEQKAMPQFMPSQIRIQYKDFSKQASIDSDFSDCLKKVQHDRRFKPTISYVIIKNKNRFLKEYIFYIQNDQENIQFFLILNTKNKQVKIVDYVKQTKVPLKPFVSNVINSMDVQIFKDKNNIQQNYEVNPELSPSQNKVGEIVYNAIKLVKSQNQEQRPLNDCREVHCESRDALSLPIQKEQLQIVSIFRQRNPSFTSFEAVETWEHKFKTFTQWTTLFKITKDDSSLFIYFHVFEFTATKSFLFWGQAQAKQPQLDGDNNYVLVNPQENVPESTIEEARKIVSSQFPETSSLKARKTIAREFPENYRRFVIVLRHKTSKVRYVVLRSDKETWLQQSQTIQQNLQQVNESIEQITNVKNKLQIMIDQVHHGKQINQEVKLQNIQPIVIKQEAKTNKPIQNTQIGTKTNLQIVNVVRQNNKELDKFQIIQTWNKQMDGGQRQTILVKPIYQKEQKIHNNDQQNLHSTQENQSQTKDNQVYEYHTVVKNAKSDHFVYIGHQSMQAVIQDQDGQLVEPTSLVSKSKQKIRQAKNKKIKNPQYMVIKQQIVEKFSKVKDVQEVSTSYSQNLKKFIQSSLPQSSKWKLLQIWSNKSFKTYVQYALLFENEGKIKYVFIFEWVEHNKYTLEGIIDDLSKPYINQKGHYINPNHQHDFLQSSESLLQAIVQKYPQIQESEVIKTIQRVFPNVKRYTLVVRTKNKRIKYIIHERECKKQLIQSRVLEDNLPIISKESKIKKKLVQTSINDKKELIKEQRPLNDCREVNCESRDALSLPIQKEQLQIVNIFRQRNPSYTSFEAVETWEHKFKTFTQWTTLFKITKDDSSLFIYFHVFEFTATKSFLFWGQAQAKQPQLDGDNNYVLVNPQENVPESTIEEARKIVSSQFPETSSLKARKTIAREFPENYRRFVIVLRHKTSKVRYVVLRSDKETWLQQSQTIQFGLDQINQQIALTTQLKHNLQVVVSTVSNQASNTKQISQSNEPKSITLTPKNDKQVTLINQQFQSIKVEQSSTEGRKISKTRSIGVKQEKQRIKFVKITKRYIKFFSANETQMLEQEQPLTVITQQFCYHADNVLIYQYDNNIIVFAYRCAINENAQDCQYLGKHSFVKNQEMSENEIVEKSTSLRSSFVQKNALELIATKYQQYKDIAAKKQIISQLGDHVRASLVFNINGFSNRFLINVSPSGDYNIIEQCKLQQIKDIHTQTKVLVTGETSIQTNDIEKIIKQDQTTKQVIQNIKREVNEVRTQDPVSVQMTDYQKKTEYVINFNTHTNQETLTQQQISVVHDKVTHNNQIIAVENIKKPEQSSPTFQKSENSQQSQKTGSHSSQKFIVVSGISAEVPKQVHQAIGSVTEQVRQSENIAPEDIVVKQTLVRANNEESKVQKIQQIVQNQQTGQQLLVSAIINTETSKVVIEDVKQIDDHIIKHFQPIQAQTSQSSKLQQTDLTQQKIEIKPQEVSKLLIQVQKQIADKQISQNQCKEIQSYINKKEGQQNEKSSQLQPKQKLKQAAPQQIVILPADIQSVVQNIKNDISTVKTQQKIQQFTPPVSQTKQEVVSFLQTIKPETGTAKVISSSTQNYPNSVATHIVSQTEQKTIYATVLKTDNGNQLAHFETLQKSKQSTLQSMVSDIQKQDTASYQPVDPELTNIAKATQIVSSQPVAEFQKKIDISKSDQKVQEIVQVIRSEYPTLSTSTVISASQTKISPSLSQVKVDFYIPETNNNYKVDEAKVQISTVSSEQTYTVTSLTEIASNGTTTNVVLEKTDPSHSSSIINAAYGFQKINLSQASKNQDLQIIQKQIQKRYGQFITSQTVNEIQSLQLKSGKVNYIFRYSSAYFTIYWDSILKRIIFLNQVSNASRTEFTAVKDNDIFIRGLEYIVGLHPSQFKNYKTLSTGQSMSGLNIIFQIQILSSSKKYRSVFQVNKQSMDTTQVLFIELIQIPMRENKLKQIKLLAQQYQKIDIKSLKADRYFTMVDQFAKNKNPFLVNSKIIGVSFKSQNLGFSYRVTYMIDDSRIVQIQIYIETFSQKYSQISMKYLDFDSGFLAAQIPSQDIEKYAKSIAQKASILFVKDQFLILNIQAKQFYEGCLFRFIVSLNGVDYEALVYADQKKGNINLIRWRLKNLGDGCEIKGENNTKCTKCLAGFIILPNQSTCLRQIPGCQIYGDDKTMCSLCKPGYEKINSLCTNDCGLLCNTVSFP